METQLTRIQPFSKTQKSIRVLLVEEMLESTRAYVRSFVEMGIDNIQVAHDLPEAEHQIVIKKQPFDLIVVDDSFWKNKSTALELCRTIRSNEDYERTALVLISNDCDRLEIEAAFRSGVDEFLPKYTSLRELKRLALQAILDRKQATVDL